MPRAAVALAVATRLLHGQSRKSAYETSSIALNPSSAVVRLRPLPLPLRLGRRAGRLSVRLAACLWCQLCIRTSRTRPRTTRTLEGERLTTHRAITIYSSIVIADRRFAETIPRDSSSAVVSIYFSFDLRREANISNLHYSHASPVLSGRRTPLLLVALLSKRSTANLFRDEPTKNTEQAVPVKDYSA